MTLLARLSLGILSLAFPLTAFAAAPDNVTGIKAFMENGKVKVTWNLNATQDIKTYRIFYSHTSILKENGLYDDFDTVDGSTNLYTFSVTPPVDTLYVSVLAVNDKSEESPYFVEEASVKIGAAGSTTTPSSTPTTVAQGQTSATLRLVSAEKASSTGVLLTFSDTVLPSTDSPLALFSLTYGSGQTLGITGAGVKGNKLLIMTAPQTPGTVYLLKIIGNLKGQNAAGAALAMDPSQPPVFVQEASAMPAPAGDHADITNLRLRATNEGGGRYTVEASWNAPNADGIDGFIVSQSIDGGKTYGPALKVPATSRGISIPHITGKQAGVAVRTLYMDGQQSRGIFQSVAFGNGTVKPPVGSVTGQNNNGGSLPESGVSLWALLTLTGAGMAWKKMREQRQAA